MTEPATPAKAESVVASAEAEVKSVVADVEAVPAEVEAKAKSAFKSLVTKYGKPVAVLISVVAVLALYHFA